MSRKIGKLSGLAVVTGASSGLAKLAAADGCRLVLAADRDLSTAERELRQNGAESIETVECDLATSQDIDALMAQIGERHVDVLFANAGHGGGGAFLDQDWEEARHIVATNVMGRLAEPGHKAA